MEMILSKVIDLWIVKSIDLLKSLTNKTTDTDTSGAELFFNNYHINDASHIYTS